MSKEDIAYGIGGVVLGLVLGFMVANWSRAGMSATTSSTSAGEQGSRSVNSGGQPELPKDHPDIDQTASPSPQDLPAGHPEVGGESQSAAPLELPSLDPLPAGSQEKRTEQQFKNIQMLRGLPADRLESIMFSFRAALGVDCTHCHIKDQWEKDDKQAKQIARKMIQMTRDINKQYVGGIGRVTCFTCHRGQLKPQS